MIESSHRLLLSLVVAGLALAFVPAHADTLLIKRARMAQPITRPARGMNMAQVEQHAPPHAPRQRPTEHATSPEQRARQPHGQAWNTDRRALDETVF